MLKKIRFSCQINLTIGERPNMKNIEPLNLTRKVNLLRLLRENWILISLPKSIHFISQKQNTSNVISHLPPPFP